MFSGMQTSSNSGFESAQVVQEIGFTNIAAAVLSRQVSATDFAEPSTIRRCRFPMRLATRA